MSFSYSKELLQLTIFSHSLWLMQLLHCCPLWTLPLSCLLSVLAITQLIISFLLSEARKSIHRENLHAFGEQTAAVCSHPLQQEQFMIAWLHTFMTFAKKYCLLIFMPEVFTPRLTRHLFNVLRKSVKRFRRCISGTTAYWAAHSQYAGLLQGNYSSSLLQIPHLNSALELMIYYSLVFISINTGTKFRLLKTASLLPQLLLESELPPMTVMVGEPR